MKNIVVTCLTVLALTMVSSVALAEGSQVKLPADVAACVNACTGSSPSGAGSCCEDSDRRLKVLEADLAQRRAWLEAARKNVRPQVDRVKQLQDQLKSLNESVDKNAGELARVAGELAVQTKKLEDLTKDVKNLAEKVSGLERDLADLKKTVDGHDATLADHSKRLEKLELAPPSIRVGFHAGVLGLHAFGSGTDFTAVPITASLTFPISKRVTVFTEAGATLSGDRYAVGTVLHGAAQYHFDPHWSIDGGVTSVWAGFNNHLKAAQASFLADVGPTYTNGVFMARAGLLAGPAFEPSPKGASFALGGTLSLGVVLP